MAGRISKETINQIHAQTDIVALVGEVTKLERRSGNDFWGCCPFHTEKTPSFHVDGDKNMFYCFSCHKSGNAISFIMETQNLKYVEALHLLAKRANIEIKYEDGFVPEEYKYDDTKDKLIDLYDRTANLFHYFLLERPEGKEALDYLTNRGLTKETIEKFKIGYAPANIKWLKSFLKSKNFSDKFLAESKLFSKNYPDIAFFNDRVMFPIFNRQGQTVAFSGRILHSKDPATDRKYMNTPEMIQYKKRETLYGFNFAKNAIRNTKTVIFCEGNMDVIAYHQAGIEYAVATCGTALTEDHLKMVRGFANTVILAFDTDTAGINATIKSIYMCRNFDFTVKILQLQMGKDASEILQNFGKENLTKQISNSILDSDFLLNRLGKLYPVDTPEGKTRAALEFFQYIDSLQTDIQKETSLDQLCQTFNLRPEAVRRDFINRNQAQNRLNSNQNRQNNQTDQNHVIQLNAEIRGILAVTSNLGQFSILREQLTGDDFQDPTARRIFDVLEECYKENILSLSLILDRCQDRQLVQLITDSVSSGAYNKNNAEAVTQDFIKFMKRSSLEAKIFGIQNRIKSFVPVTQEDYNILSSLLKEKMELESQASKLK